MVQMQASAALSQVPGGNAEAGLAVLDVMFSLMSQVENVTLTLDVTADDILAALDVTAREDTDIAKLSSQQSGGTAMAGLWANNNELVKRKIIILRT